MERAWTKLFWLQCMWCPLSTLLCIHFFLSASGTGLQSLKNSVFSFLDPKPFELNHYKGRHRDSKGTRDFLVILAFMSFLKMWLFKISNVLAKASIIPCQTILSSQPMKALAYNIKLLCFPTCMFFYARPPLAVPYSSPEFSAFKINPTLSILLPSCRYHRCWAGASRLGSGWLGSGSATGGGARRL